MKFVAALAARRIEDEDRSALLLGFAFHFCVLASYYLVRPLRDALGLEGGADNLQWLFTATFVVMLGTVPLFGALVSRLPAARFVPLIYRFVAISMVSFGLLIANHVAPVVVGRAFFVWISIYNLFVVSIFWSVLVDRFSTEQGKRLFGFIAAGGTLGTFAGPLLAAAMTKYFGPVALTLMAAVLLELAVRCYRGLLSCTRCYAKSQQEDKGTGGSMLAGVTLIGQSPYLLGLVLFMLLHTTAATFLYFEQGRIIASSYADMASRTQFFATVDFIVSVITLAFQLLLAGPLIRMTGAGGALITLPIATFVAFASMALAPMPTTVALAQGLRRAVEFAFVRPAREVLWTVVSQEEKYKAKSVVETVVYRGGDALGGWLSVGLSTLGAGFGVAALLVLPIAGGWGWLSLWLAKHQGVKATADARRDSQVGVLHGQSEQN